MSASGASALSLPLDRLAKVKDHNSHNRFFTSFLTFGAASLSLPQIRSTPMSSDVLYCLRELLQNESVPRE